MKTRISFWIGIFSMLLLLSLFLAPQQRASGRSDLPAPGVLGIQINEVMFKPASGYEWVEIKNYGAASVEINGYGLTDEANHWYVIPNALPPVPAGAFVIILYDGKGSGFDDYNFSDSLATLHTPAGLTGVLGDEGGQVGLYTAPFNRSETIYLPVLIKLKSGASSPAPEESAPAPGAAPDYAPDAAPTAQVVSFVAWGAPPGNRASYASAVGLWNPEWYVPLDAGQMVLNTQVVTQPGGSVGLLPKSTSAVRNKWLFYKPTETTQGRENRFPSVYWTSPDSGNHVNRSFFALIWGPVSGATSYRFQLSSSSGFSPLLVDTTLYEPCWISSAGLANGRYYWRVKVRFNSDESAWSAASELNVTDLVSQVSPAEADAAADAAAVQPIFLGEDKIRWQRQHKDTNMLDLDGSAETGLAAWDVPHNSEGQGARNLMDEMYCARASIAMMAQYYGGSLTQDRISYYIKGGGWPEDDLGYGSGFNKFKTPLALNWALNAPVTGAGIGGYARESFATIKSQIDHGQPILTSTLEHVFLIVGYYDLPNNQLVYILDPASKQSPSHAPNEMLIPMMYAELKGDLWMWVGPEGQNGAPNVRSDEDFNHNGISDALDDADQDGVSDFDENIRFPYLSAGNPDSDGDGVNDKQEIREYLFDDAGSYHPTYSPDYDQDGLRKEADPDNDNGGAQDGSEDVNGDGHYQSGETFNFNAADDPPNAIPQQPPYRPTVASPQDQASNQDINITLAWSGGDPNNDKVTYTVYLAEGDVVPNAVVCVTPLTSCAPGTLKPLTKYSWRVLARDEHGKASSSDLLRFTTGSGPNHPPNMPSSPNPTDGTTIQQLRYTLTWLGGDPDGDAVTYSVLFDTNNPPQTQLCFYNVSPSCSSGELAPQTTYFWRVIAHDSRGASQTGPVWRFSTAALPPGTFNKVSPSNGMSNQPSGVTLTWSAADGATVYDYCITEALTCSSWTPLGKVTQVTPGALLANRTYYWQVRARNSGGTTYANGSAAATWRFTTAAAVVTVRLDSAFSTDYFDSPLASFRQGQAMELALTATNTTSQALQVSYTWDTYDPTNTRIDYLSYGPWTSTIQPGSTTLYITRGIPAASRLGQYTFTAGVTYNGARSEKSTTFNVSGSPIGMRFLEARSCRGLTSSNTCSGETDTFTPADPYIYIWQAWEGGEGSHTIHWDWYRPNGTLMGATDYPFTGNLPLWYSWTTGSIANSTNYGQWHVDIYLDGAFIATKYFTYAAAAPPPEAPPQPAAEETGPAGGGSPPAPEPVRR